MPIRSVLRFLSKLILDSKNGKNRTKVVFDYALAASIAVVALSARFATNDLFSQFGFPFIFFFPAVLATAFLTSFWPSIFCSLLSIAFAWYFFVHPERSFFPVNNNDLFALFFFAAVLFTDCIVIHLMKRSMTRIKVAEAETRKAVKRQDDFLSVMAHELRNPIHVIKACAMIAQRNPASSENKVKIIERQVVQMERIVSDLLDVARINTGKINISRVSMDLAKVVKDTVESFVNIAAQRQQEMVLSIPDGVISINGDASRLTQVIENVFSNASKFSPRNSAIKTTVYLSADTATIKVTDFGKGIPPESLESVFKFNVQTEAADIQMGGLGIGLALSLYIINQHGGSIFASSDGIGQGSTITMVLPLIDAFSNTVDDKAFNFSD